MTEGRRSDRDQQGPGRQIPSPEASMAAGLGGAERNGAGSVQPLETVRDQSLRPWHERPLPSSSPALTFPPVPPAPGTRDLRPAVRHPSVPSPTPALPRAPARPQTTLCQDGDGNGASVTPVTPTPGAPGDAREGTGRHVLPAMTIFRKGGEAEGKTPADQGGHVFQSVSHPRASSLPQMRPGG